MLIISAHAHIAGGHKSHALVLSFVGQVQGAKWKCLSIPRCCQDEFYLWPGYTTWFGAIVIVVASHSYVCPLLRRHTFFVVFIQWVRCAHGPSPLGPSYVKGSRNRSANLLLHALLDLTPVSLSSSFLQDLSYISADQGLSRCMFARDTDLSWIQDYLRGPT